VIFFVGNRILEFSAGAGLQAAPQGLKNKKRDGRGCKPGEEELANVMQC